MAYAPHDDFRKLYDAYTGADSTGLHLTQHMVRLTEDDPLLVVTGADFAIFPGGRRAPPGPISGFCAPRPRPPPVRAGGG